MRLRNLFLTSACTVLTAAVLALTVGCSSSNDGGTNGPAPVNELDEITVSLNKLTVKYDCDYDPVGVDQPGDFHYAMNVDTLADNGVDWLPASKNKEASAKVSNGNYKNITGQIARFELPRTSGAAFRVRMGLREADVGGNDFKSSHSVIHVYSSGSSQLYAPEGGKFSSYSSSTAIGTMDWTINKRSREWNYLGILTVEGCNATLSYTVKVRKAQ
jgi:hypothetical protein